MSLDPELKALRDGWYKEAREQTIETLPAFMAKLAAHPHDYNTICYAAGAAAMAAAVAIDRSPHGGITGFQAGAIMWEFVTEWMQEQDRPLRLVRYEQMLYPQYAHAFEKRISQETADWLREQAKARLDDVEDAHPAAHPAVVAHWRDLARGVLPFGYTIGDDL